MQPIPTATVPRATLVAGKLPAAQLLKLTGLCPSISDAWRSISQGGAYLGAEKTRIEKHDQQIAVEDGLLVWVGKKRFCRVEVAD